MHANAFDTAVVASRFLQISVDQVIIAFVGHGFVSAGDQFSIHAFAVFHGVNFFVAQGRSGLVRHAPNPAVFIINGYKGMAIEGVVTVGWNHGVPRHDPLRDSPVVGAGFGISSRANQEATTGLLDLKEGLFVALEFGAFGAFVQGVGVQLAAVQKRHMARINAPFHGLQVVGFLQPFGDVAVGTGHQIPFEFGQRRLLTCISHVGPYHATLLNTGVGPELDALTVAAVGCLGGDIDALTVHVVFPAMVGATDTVLFIASKPQGDASVGAKLVNQADTAIGVSKCQ